MVNAPWMVDDGFPIPHVEPRYEIILPNLQWMIIADGILTDQFKITLFEIDRVAMLQDGWDSYGGHGISEESCFAAISLAGRILANDTPPPSVVPMSSGGISFEWHQSHIDLEVEIENLNSCRVYFENDLDDTLGEFVCDRDNEDDLIAIVRKLAD